MTSLPETRPAGGDGLPPRFGVTGPALTYGFATAVVMWCVWFVTHLPMLGLEPRVLGPVLLVLLLAGSAVAGRAAPAGRGWLAGGLAGLVAALVNLLILGSELTKQPAAAAAAPAPGLAGLRPEAGLMVAGFLATGAVLGLVGGLMGGIRPRPPRSETWLGRFAWAAALAFLPLLLIGGLVTSTQSGMAVPDWPTTRGANMFLYPIGLMSHPRVFLEHSHRLFGSMVGLTTFVLMAWAVLGTPGARFGLPARVAALVGLVVATAAIVWAAGWLARIESLYTADPKSWPPLVGALGLAAWVPLAVALVAGAGARVRAWAVAIFFAVCVQGLLGAFRVTENKPALAAAHGILAQLVFAAAVALAVSLTPAYVRAVLTPPAVGDRRLRAMSTAALHITLVQLILGAFYRHFPHQLHILWTHAAFSLAVMAAGTVAGSVAAKRAAGDGLDLVVRRIGKTLITLLGVQFMLGWGALFAALSGERGPTPTHDVMDTVAAVPAWQALLRTAHQANGALVIATTAALVTFARRLAPRRRSGTV